MPTKKEIEVAACAMMLDMFAPHELPLDAGLQRKYHHTARSALEAAERVRREDELNRGILD